MSLKRWAIAVVVGGLAGSWMAGAQASPRQQPQSAKAGSGSVGTEQEQLGEIRIRDPERQQQPNLQLLLRSSTFSSSNVTGVGEFAFSNRGFRPSGVSFPEDTVFVNGAFLQATPQLGDSTRLVAYGGGNLTRFADNERLNYNALNWGIGLRHQLTPRVTGSLTFQQDNLYSTESGDRLLRDNTVRARIQRQDRLTPQLVSRFDYQLQAHFADPDARSRIRNQAGLDLHYSLTPKLDGILGYQLAFASFTEHDRFNFEQQIRAALHYELTPRLFLEGSVSYLAGNASLDSRFGLDRVNPDNLSVGVRLGYNLPLF